MAFTARTFIFGETPSEFHNIFLGEFSGSGDSSNPTSSDIQPLTQKLFRRPVPLFFGSEQIPILSFPLSMYSEKEISAESFSEISTWLYASMEYKKLRICQPDMYEMYFNAFLTQPYIIRTGNIIHGTSCTVLCDSPFAWSYDRTFDYNYNPNAYSITDNIPFLNISANNFYTYPTNLTITANIFGGNIINNESF